MVIGQRRAKRVNAYHSIFSAGNMRNEESPSTGRGCNEVDGLLPKRVERLGSSVESGLKDSSVNLDKGKKGKRQIHKKIKWAFPILKVKGLERLLLWLLYKWEFWCLHNNFLITSTPKSFIWPQNLFVGKMGFGIWQSLLIIKIGETIFQRTTPCITVEVVAKKGWTGEIVLIRKVG